jgi:hypothetical protein
MAPENTSRQSQEKADGVTPVGFFSGTHPQRATLSNPAAPRSVKKRTGNA